MLDAANRQLVVHLDQADLARNNQTVDFTHTVRFRGTDVFGNTIESKVIVQTFPAFLRPRPISSTPLVFVNPLLIHGEIAAPLIPSSLLQP